MNKEQVEEIIRLNKQMREIEDSLNNPFYIRDVKNKVIEGKDYVAEKLVSADKFVRSKIWEF